jgi:hypothetical protein
VTGWSLEAPTASQAQAGPADETAVR